MRKQTSFFGESLKDALALGECNFHTYFYLQTNRNRNRSSREGKNTRGFHVKFATYTLFFSLCFMYTVWECYGALSKNICSARQRVLPFIPYTKNFSWHTATKDSLAWHSHFLSFSLALVLPSFFFSSPSSSFLVFV